MTTDETSVIRSKETRHLRDFDLADQCEAVAPWGWVAKTHCSAEAQGWTMFRKAHQYHVLFSVYQTTVWTRWCDSPEEAIQAALASLAAAHAQAASLSLKGAAALRSTTRRVIPVVEVPRSPRVLRGGSWGLFARFSRASDRTLWPPDDADDFVGFRHARNLPCK